MISPGPLFTVSKLNDEFLCRCGQLASFQITVAGLADDPQDNKWCDLCATAFILQFMKNAGVELEEIQDVFPKLSAAVDAPPASLIVQ